MQTPLSQDTIDAKNRLVDEISRMGLTFAQQGRIEELAHGIARPCGKPSNHLTLLPERLSDVPAETLSHFRRGPQSIPGSAWALVWCPPQYNGYGPTRHSAYLISTDSINPVHNVIEYRTDPMTLQAISRHHRERSLLGIG